MDIIESLNASQIRSRIFLAKVEISDLKLRRRKHHKEIRNAKNLIKNIERCIDKKCESEIANFEVSSAAGFLKYLRENLAELDYYWRKEVEYCAQLHRRLDCLGEKVYI